MFTSKTLLFLTLLVALFVASSAQSCSLFANCDDCVGEGSGSCGWCESTSECLAGNSVGPGGVASNCTEWFYDNCLAVDCFRFTSCSTCLRDPFCGWCQSTTTCVEGLRTGPVTGTCNDYIFDRSSCPSTSTTGRRSSSTASSTSGRRSSSTASSTSGRRSSSTASSTSGRRSSSTASSVSTTASSVSTTASSVSTTGGSSSTSGRRATSSTGRRATSSSGRRATSSTGRRATSTSGRRATSSTGRRASSSTAGTSVSTISSTISSTTGVASSGAAYSINSASLFVAIGVVVIALVNLLF